jgi:transcription antitermination factor NusG
MPTLPRELDLFPDDLLDRPKFAHNGDGTWWALYCRSRQEKKLMRRLGPLGVPFYGPLVPRRYRLPSGRIRTSYIPLFPNYVFVYGDASHRRTAQETGCVSRWLDVSDPVKLTDDLRRVRHLIRVGEPVTPEAKLGKGMRVRVRSGPFAGFEGFVIRREKETRLLVAVRFLQRGASVLLEDCQLEWID